jgi:hypothetical protein
MWVAPNMNIQQACEAIKSMRRIELRYSGSVRVVEIHAAGYTQAQNPIMRAWQVRGGSSGGSSTGWKLLRIDEVESSIFLDERSEAPRPGYRKGDPAMATIVCEV